MAVDDVILANLRQISTAIKLNVQKNVSNLTEDEIMSVSMLFDEWQVGGDYKTKDVLRYNGALYQVLQNVNNAQAEHIPDVAASLYKRIGEPDSSGIFPWVQPLGATDAYKKDDKVSHKGKAWKSDIDNNVREPGVYGWTEVHEE